MRREYKCNFHFKISFEHFLDLVDNIYNIALT